MCMCVTTSELGVLLSMRSDLYERHVRLGRVAICKGGFDWRAATEVLNEVLISAGRQDGPRIESIHKYL